MKPTNDTLSVVSQTDTIAPQSSVKLHSKPSSSKSSQRQEMIESFLHYFSILMATTPEQKEAVYRIRYRVYCEEFQYEDYRQFPDKMESDEYDQYALHCLITHKRTGIPAACVRLVPALGDVEEFPLPLEKYCYDSIDWKFVQGLGLRREQVCEISRLAVDRVFRRRAGEKVTRFGKPASFSFDKKEIRTFPLLAIASFFGATALTVVSGRTRVFAMMEPFLPRLLNRSGIVFQRAGTDVDYHGIRAPYFIKTESVIAGIRDELRPLYHKVLEQIRAS